MVRLKGAVSPTRGEVGGWESVISKSLSARLSRWGEEPTLSWDETLWRRGLDDGKDELSSSSEDSSGVMVDGLGTEREDRAKRMVCLVVGEVRNGRVRGF